MHDIRHMFKAVYTWGKNKMYLFSIVEIKWNWSTNEQHETCSISSQYQYETEVEIPLFESQSNLQTCRTPNMAFLEAISLKIEGVPVILQVHKKEGIEVWTNSDHCFSQTPVWVTKIHNLKLWFSLIKPAHLPWTIHHERLGNRRIRLYYTNVVQLHVIFTK